jgi:hypothetical protein
MQTLKIIGVLLFDISLIIITYLLFTGAVSSFGSDLPPVSQQVVISETQYAQILTDLKDFEILSTATPTFEIGTIPIKITKDGVSVPETVPATLTLGYLQWQLDVHLNPEIHNYKNQPIYHISPTVQVAIDGLSKIGVSAHIDWDKIEGGINFMTSSLSSDPFSINFYLAYKITSWFSIGYPIGCNPISILFIYNGY